MFQKDSNDLSPAAVKILLGQLLLCKVMSSPTSQPVAELEEFCQWETFNASCGPQEVVIMEEARYGRMRFGRCMKEDHGSVGCSAVVLQILDDKCSGRRTCKLTVPDVTLHSIHPCPRELMPYLEARYSCVSVKSDSSEACALFGNQPLEPFVGHVSSLTVLKTGVGTRECPWFIDSREGQKINLTLYSFSSSSIVSTPTSHRAPQSPMLMTGCPWTILVVEGSMTTELAACSTGLARRDRLVYSSQSHRLSFYVRPNIGLGTAMADVRLLIKYQIFGCADKVERQPNAHVTRRGDKTIVTCLTSDYSYILTCINETWTGKEFSCDDIGKVEEMEERVDLLQEQPVVPIQYGLIVIISIGVIFGLILGIILLFAALACFNRSSDKKEKSDSKKAATKQAYTKKHKIEQTDKQLHAASDIMKLNVEKIMERDDKLRELENRSTDVSQKATTFKVQAHNLKNKYWWQNEKWLILIICCVLLFLIWLFAW